MYGMTDDFIDSTTNLAKHKKALEDVVRAYREIAGPDGAVDPALVAAEKLLGLRP